jgi:hypothetical protein
MLPLPQKINVAEVKLLKWRSYGAIGWALVVMVCMMAVFRGHPMGVTAAMITVMLWSLTRIVRDGLDGLMFLRAMKKAEEEVKSEEE